MAALTSAYVHSRSSASQIVSTRRMKCTDYSNCVPKLLGGMRDGYTLVINTTYSQNLPTLSAIVVCSTHLNPTFFNTNNLLPTNKRVKLLATPPAILHTSVLL